MDNDYIEKTIAMNMCMIYDNKGNVLALDKVGKNYSGITFPGGHVEPKEGLVHAVIREIKEETGLNIYNPVLCGIYHWYKDDIHNIGYLYKTSEFDGQLKSSSEGRVYWIPMEEYKKIQLAYGMDKILEIMTNDNINEVYMS